MDINDLIQEGNSFKFSMGKFGYSLNDTFGYTKWKEKCKRYLNSEFPNDKFIETFEKKCDETNNPTTQSALIGCLESFRDMPTIIEKPLKIDKNTGTIVTVQQNQHVEQSQSQEIAINIFLESIKDELTGKQIKEIKAIVTEEPEPEKAKSKIIEKLKGFGENVLSNIVANVITNPTIWSGLM